MRRRSESLKTTVFAFARSRVTVLALVYSFVVLARGQSDSLLAHMNAGKHYLEARDMQNAAQEFRSFLAQALHVIANGKAQAGDFAGAQPLFEQSSAFEPNNADISLDFAAASFDADKLSIAKAAAQHAVELLPQDAHAHFLLARVLFRLEEYPAARAQLENAASIHPDFNTLYLLAKTYLLLHQDKLVADVFSRIVSAQGDSPLLRVMFGRAYSENDRVEQAIAQFDKAIALDPRNTDAHYYKGLTFLGHNEEAGYDRAIPEFQAELKADTNDFRGHYMLGYIAWKRRDLPIAERELAHARALQPNDIQTMLLLAQLYTETDRVPKAEGLLRDAIELANRAPRNEYQAGRAHYLLGRLLASSGRMAEAKEQMKLVADLQRQVGASRNITDERVMSAATLARKEPANGADSEPSAKVSSQQSSELDRLIEQLRFPIADAYNNLGAIAAQQRNLEEGINYFERAREWNPALEGIDHNLGLACFSAAQYPHAAEALGRQLAAHPQDTVARSMLGLALFKMGNYKQVVEVLRPIEQQLSSNAALAQAYSESLQKTK